MRVAFISSGKESLYALYLARGADIGLLLIYDFPKPNPHIVNIHKSIETLTLFNINCILVKKLRRGCEKKQTTDILRVLGAKEIIASDVHVGEYLKYMESIVNEVEAKLIGPLWGLSSDELLYREFKELQLETLVIGCIGELGSWLNKTINNGNLDEFIRYAKNLGIDVLGEHGEYHTLVLNTKYHSEYLKYRVVAREVYNDYYIIRLV